jgi:predicted  nucleic acid-binding Zn-ribbon protein
MQASIYIPIITFVVGALIGALLLYLKMGKLQKKLRSSDGYLESEKLKKETLQKELKTVYQAKETIELTLKQRLNEAARINKRLDEDILLLQKSNEETEELLKAGQPELHALKLQLIEANNTIARLKGMLGTKTK